MHDPICPVLEPAVFGNDPNAEVRISFVADPGSWSALGKDCLITSYFPKNEPTMNYGWLEDNTDDQEYERALGEIERLWDSPSGSPDDDRLRHQHVKRLCCE